MKRIITAFGLAILISLAVVPALGSISTVFAQEDTTVKPPAIPCSKFAPCITEKTQKEGGRSIRTYITEKWASGFFKAFLGIAGVAAVIFIIVGGLQMHLAIGNDEKLGAAKKTITWAIIGLVVSILSLAMVSIISNLNFK